jgi:hypothetical protein
MSNFNTLTTTKESISNSTSRYPKLIVKLLSLSSHSSATKALLSFNLFVYILCYVYLNIYMTLYGFHDPSTAEACALYLTTLMAIDCCFLNVDFEVDCSMVSDGVNAVFSNPRSYFGNYIRVIQTTRVSFHHCTFSQISRKANSVAHGLALLAHTEPNCIWMEDTHPHIVHVVFKDLF